MYQVKLQMISKWSDPKEMGGKVSSKSIYCYISPLNLDEFDVIHVSLVKKEKKRGEKVKKVKKKMWIGGLIPMAIDKIGIQF